MSQLDNIAPTLMTPQILFQCHYCFVKLQVPIFLSGKDGPCPQCGKMIQTPTPTSCIVEKTTAPSAHRRWTDPTAGDASSSASLNSKPVIAAAPAKRSINRGIIADIAVNRVDLEQKEGRITFKFLGWCFFVFLVCVLATYLMNSFVAGK